MVPDRHLYYGASYVLLVRDGKVLMGRRANSGFRDGWYGLPAGHIEEGESAAACAVREAKEETGVDISPAALRPVHVMFRKSETGRTYFDVFFRADAWSGEPRIGEPDKCDDMQWFPLDALPENTVPYLVQVFECIKKGDTFSETGWE